MNKENNIEEKYNKIKFRKILNKKNVRTKHPFNDENMLYVHQDEDNSFLKMSDYISKHYKALVFSRMDNNVPSSIFNNYFNKICEFSTSNLKDLNIHAFNDNLSIKFSNIERLELFASYINKEKAGEIKQLCLSSSAKTSLKKNNIKKGRIKNILDKFPNIDGLWISPILLHNNGFIDYLNNSLSENINLNFLITDVVKKDLGSIIHISGISDKISLLNKKIKRRFKIYINIFENIKNTDSKIRVRDIFNVESALNIIEKDKKRPLEKKEDPIDLNKKKVTVEESEINSKDDLFEFIRNIRDKYKKENTEVLFVDV